MSANGVYVGFKSNMSTRGGRGLCVVSLVHTADVTTESLLEPGIEHPLRCWAMWFLGCGLFSTKKQSLEVPYDCHSTHRE